MKELLEVQEQAIEKLKPLKVGALFKRPGTGKSRTSVELVQSVNDVDFVLWIAPYRSIHPKIEGSGIVTEVMKWYCSALPIEFIATETIGSSDRAFVETLNAVKERRCFIVVDESLKIKNWTAQRTKRIIEIGKHAQYKLILNGTPISKNLMDVWAQMEFLSPKILSMDLTTFENSFCKWTKIAKRMGSRKEERKFITGYANVDYLYSLIRPYVYEADLNLLVDQRHIRLEYSIGDELMEEYNALKEKYLNDEAMIMKNNNVFLEMTMKMQHAYCLAEQKFDLLTRIIKEHKAENVVVFCKFIRSREGCAKRFPEVTVLSIQADSMSLNLQSKHVTVEFDKTWDFALVDQYQHRTFRNGQTKDCIYYYLDGDVKLDTLMIENNAKKQSQLQYLKSVSMEELKEAL